MTERTIEQIEVSHTLLGVLLVIRGEAMCVSLDLTPAEARALADMLIEHASETPAEAPRQEIAG